MNVIIFVNMFCEYVHLTLLSAWDGDKQTRNAGYCNQSTPCTIIQPNRLEHAPLERSLSSSIKGEFLRHFTTPDKLNQRDVCFQRIPRFKNILSNCCSEFLKQNKNKFLWIWYCKLFDYQLILFIFYFDTLNFGFL